MKLFPSNMKTFIIFTIIVFISFCDAVNIQTTTFDGVTTDDETIDPFTKIGNNYYWIEWKNKVNWFEAANTCRTKGADLATIETEEESQAISKYLSAKGFVGFFWIGGNDLGGEGNFHWQGTGLPMEYTNWGNGQPDNVGVGVGEDCIHTWYINEKFTWNDNACTAKCYFLCQLHSPKTVSLVVW